MDSDSTRNDPVILNTKYLMVGSALFMGILGIAATFLPGEILAWYGGPSDGIGVLLVKTTGALYLGFAGLNWMARGNLIGGIYSKPVALGNFFHFAVIALSLLKWLITNQAATEIIVGAIGYTVFAVCFGYVLFSGGKACK